MIERKKSRHDYYSCQSIVDDAKRHLDNENPTPKQVVQYMIGDSDLWCGGDYCVYRYEDDTKRTFLNRLNIIWVWPLFALCLPFQYLLTGNTGVSRNSRIGRIVDKLIRFDR